MSELLSKIRANQQPTVAGSESGANDATGATAKSSNVASLNSAPPKLALSKSALAATLTERLLAANFACEGDQLVIGGVRACDLVEAYGGPLFAYDADLLRRNYRALRQAVHGFADVYFSVKANPRVAIAELFVSEGAGLEIASLAEFELARKAGCSPDRILFAGPGKGKHELAHTLGAGLGEIHLESYEEIAHVAAIAEALGRTIDVAIRVNPVAVAQGGAMRMGGKPTAFGFDEETLAGVVSAVRQYLRLRLTGVHLFAGTQILSADVLLTQWAHGLDVACHVADLMGAPVTTIDLGGGLGVPYHGGDDALDLDALSSGVAALKSRVASDPRIRGAHIVLEPGRFLAASAGIYLMQVRAVKQSRGERFVVCDGGMHHHLAASGNLGQVIKRDFPLVAASRMSAIETFQAHVVGPLCTPLDTLGRKTPMPELTQGDLIAVLQSGAYGASASPVGFLSHPAPTEVLVENGTHRAIGGFDATLVFQQSTRNLEESKAP